MKKPELAEDVLQESFIKIWHKADTYNIEKSKAMTWMATITRNKAFDKLRSLKLKPQAVDFEYEGLHFASLLSQVDYEPRQKNSKNRSLVLLNRKNLNICS